MTKYVFAKCVSSALICNEVREFDTFDGRGRRKGYAVAIIRYEYAAAETSKWTWVSEDEIGVTYHVEPQALRNGRKYGALPVRSFKKFKTIAEAEAAKEAMFIKAAAKA